MEYLIKQYSLQQGALEIQYIEEFFLDFPRKKTAAEVIQRLSERDHQILMAEAPLPDDPGMIVPVSFKVSHELRAQENDPKLADLVAWRSDPLENAKTCTERAQAARVLKAGVVVKDLR